MYLITTQCVHYYLVRGYPLSVRPSLTIASYLNVFPSLLGNTHVPSEVCTYSGGRKDKEQTIRKRGTKEVTK